VGVFATADRPAAHWPVGKVERVQFRDLGAWARLAVDIDGQLPGIGSHGQHRGAYPLVGGQADREPHAQLA
jgi:hypothetical protein